MDQGRDRQLQNGEQVVQGCDLSRSAIGDLTRASPRRRDAEAWA